MRNTIISDASYLIILANIGELTLLHEVYDQITTTPEIASEYGDLLPGWIKIVEATDKYKQRLLELQLDKGESSALELPNSILILDDYKARKITSHLDLTVTGTLGVIIKAKLKGIIPSIKPILSQSDKPIFVYRQKSSC